MGNHRPREGCHRCRCGNRRDRRRLPGNHPSLVSVWDYDKALTIRVENNAVVFLRGIELDPSSSHGVSVASIAAGSDLGNTETPGVAAGAT